MRERQASRDRRGPHEARERRERRERRRTETGGQPAALIEVRRPLPIDMPLFQQRVAHLEETERAAALQLVAQTHAMLVEGAERAAVRRTMAALEGGLDQARILVLGAEAEGRRRAALESIRAMEEARRAMEKDEVARRNEFASMEMEELYEKLAVEREGKKRERWAARGGGPLERLKTRLAESMGVLADEVVSFPSFFLVPSGFSIAVQYPTNFPS